MGPKGKQPRSRPVEVAGEPAVDAGSSNNTSDSTSAPLSARAGAQDPINSQASGTVGSGTAEGVEGANSVNTTNPPPRHDQGLADFGSGRGQQYDFGGWDRRH